MYIKKNATPNSVASSTPHRLAAYSRQAKQYLNNRADISPLTSALPDWKKSTLAALISLAATSAAHAQCQGGLGPTLLGPNQNFLVDVDADGMNDIRFHGGPLSSFGYGLQFWQATAVNPQFYIGLTSVGKARGAQDGFVVTRGQPFAQGPLDMCRSGAFGQFCLSYTTRSITVRKGDAVTGRPGWIRLSVNALFGVGGVQFTVTDRGLESTSNIPSNSAIVNDCASMVFLPVEMSRFQAMAEEKQIVLDWATASELHNSGFEVQRSTDGRLFGKIGWVNGAGTSANLKEYTFIDKELQTNTLYYYRLRQLDHNGAENFTPVRSARIKDGNSMTVAQIFPNPVNQGIANFRAEVPQEGILNIHLFDARGSLVKDVKQVVRAGENAFSVFLHDVASGIYFAKMHLGKDVIYQRLIVSEQ